jgi:hypothetical protein
VTNLQKNTIRPTFIPTKCPVHYKSPTQFVKIFRIFQGAFCAYFPPTDQLVGNTRFSRGQKTGFFGLFLQIPRNFQVFSLKNWDKFVKTGNKIIKKSQGFVKISRRLVKIILDLFSKKP